MCSAESNDAVDPPGNPEVQRTVDPGQRFQTTEGWGTSLCWFGNVVGGWSDDRRNAVADLLFDDEQGLGLNVIRYNIGGGEAPDHNHMGYGKEMPGFKPTEGGDYDFDADANQRWMLDAAIARIDASDIILEAFSNSPPWWMTNSGCASGAQGGTNNLKSEYVDDFADYLTEVVLHFRDSWGISFRTLEPMNEPMVGWSYNGGQEGCHIERPDQPTLLHEVRSQLDEKGLSEVQLAAPDETALDETVTSYNSYDNATRDLVSQINTHAYYGSQRSQLRDLADRDGKRLWSSEIDGSGAPAPFDVYPHNHEDIVPGLDIAQRITRDLREMHVDAWIFWQAVESEQAQTNLNKNWGLLHGDFENNSEQTYLTKKYYTMKQYSGFIRPGFVMISVDDADAVAFVSEELGRLVIVQRRAENSDSVYSYDLSGFAAVGGHTAVYRTSASENFERLSDIAIAGSSLTVPVKGQSITTFVVDCVDP
jgi:O-glycosyl hydrolase